MVHRRGVHHHAHLESARGTAHRRGVAPEQSLPDRLPVGDSPTRPPVGGAPGRVAERGYSEGRNLVFERRFSEGNAERFPEFAAEMVQLRVDSSS